MRASSRPSLTGSFVAFTISVVVVVVLCLAYFIHGQSQRALDGALDRAVRLRTQAASKEIARTLHADWRDLTFLAQAIAKRPEDAQALMDGMRGDGNRVAWIGYAGVDGTVQAATGGMLLGANVKKQPWFQSGLMGGFGSDVHDAKLLASLMQKGDEPLRFIQLALPIPGPDGPPQGVLGMHIRADWLHTYVRELAQSMGVDLFLIAPDGSVSVASRPTSQENFAAISRVAAVGVARSMRMTDSDGSTRFAALVPNVTYGDLPNFGWHMVGKINTQSLLAVVEDLRVGALTMAAVAALTIAALCAAYQALFLRPLVRLVGVAHRIAHGSPERPPAPTSTKEAALLADAAVLLQRADSPPPGGHHGPDPLPPA